MVRTQVDLVEAYWNNVFEPFLDAYSEVRTTVLLRCFRLCLTPCT